MTKSDLKTGMIVTCENGYRYLIIYNPKTVNDGNVIEGIGCSSGAWRMGFDELTEDLKYKPSPDFDIVKVEILKSIMDIKGVLNHHSYDSRIIWTRPKKKKYTYEQIKEILGEEFEIVKE